MELLEREGFKKHRESLSKKDLALSKKSLSRQGFIVRVTKGNIRAGKFTSRIIWIKKKASKASNVAKFNKRYRKAKSQPGSVGFSGTGITKDSAVEERMKQTKTTLMGGHKNPKTGTQTGGTFRFKKPTQKKRGPVPKRSNAHLPPWAKKALKR